MNKLIGTSILMMAVTVCVPAFAGTLRIGQPVVQGDQVTVPVLLEGDVADGVAAISFQLNYDPAAVEPQQATAGAAAQSAGKEVMVNVKEPGTYMVVMAGLNSNTLASGEVTNIVLQRRGEDSSTNISITGTTFASLQGDEIPSRGSTGSISFTEGEQEPEDAEEDQEETPADEEQAPEQEDNQGDDKTSDPISIDVPESEMPARRTPSTAAGNNGEAGSPAITPAQPSTSGGESDAGETQKLAEALSAAASSRSSIGARPSETTDAAQEKDAEGKPVQSETESGETQMAAVTEDTAPGAPGGAVTVPTDTAVSARPASPSGDGATASVVQENPVAADNNTPLQDDAGDQKGGTQTLIFLVIAVGVIVAILLLRRRLFA